MASQPDNQPVEVGVKFESDVSGFITGLRFYKGPNNTGTHIGNSPVPSSDPADMSAPALTPGTYTCMVVVDP